MIGRVLRLAFGVAVVAAIVDAYLARRSGGRPVGPIRSTVEIAAPIDAVWAVLSDVPRQPEWMADLKAVRLLTPPPLGAGTRAEGTVRIMGITVRDPITITAFDPPHRFAIRHEGLFTGAGVITLEPTADATGTRVTWDETLLAPVVPHLAGALGRPVLATVFQNDLHNLRAMLED